MTVILKILRNRFFFLFLVLATCLLNANGQVQFSIKGPYLQNTKDTEVTIVWETNKESIGWVELAPLDGTHFYHKNRPAYYNSSFGIKNISKIHSVHITNLKPGTTYRYRVYSKEVYADSLSTQYGRSTATDVFRKEPLIFTTTDPYKKNTTFLMINDIHGKTDLLNQLLHIGNYKETDVILFNGDMIDNLNRKEEIFEGFMNLSINLFAKEKTLYYTRGNHETRGFYAPNLKKHFNCCEKEHYYTFRQGPIFYIVLDSGEDKADTDIEYSNLADFDKYRTKQASWLAEVVKTKDFKEAPFKVVVCHMPPAPSNELWHGQLDILNKFVPILNDASIDVMLCGHLHKYLYIESSSTINFPIIVNSNHTVLSAQADNNKLQIIIKDIKGKLIDKKTL